jgi:hypothetical protein
MLLPDNVHPEQCLYFNGAFVLKAIQAKSPQDLLELFISAKDLQEMTMPVFVLCLDWLYLLNVVDIRNDGKIEICT